MARRRGGNVVVCASIGDADSSEDDRDWPSKLFHLHPSTLTDGRVSAQADFLPPLDDIIAAAGGVGGLDGERFGQIKACSAFHTLVSVAETALGHQVSIRSPAATILPVMME